MDKHLRLPTLYIEKICALILSVVFLVSSTMTGSFAWHYLENAVNSFFGGGRDYSVVLEKYERDLDGNETEIPVQGAVFILYFLEEINETTGVTEFRDVLVEENLVTDENGRIKAADLKKGEYYFLETSPSYGYTYDRDAEEQDIRKYYFSIQKENTDDEKMVSVKAYNQRLAGQLNLTKTVQNKDGTELTEEQIQQEFKFHISFNEEGEYYYVIYSDGDRASEEQKLAAGTIVLKHGEKAVFKNLPAGIHYSITEEIVPGYTVQSNNNENHVPTLAESEDGITAEFVNIYDEDLLNTAPFIVSKEVTGTDIDLEQEFSFRVYIGNDPEHEYTYRIKSKKEEQKEERTGSLKSGEVLILKHGEQAVFEGIPIGTKWEAEELDQNGYIPLSIKMTGTILDIEANYALFINHADEEQTGDLLITKEVTGVDIDLEQEFLFHISFSDGKEGNLPMTYSYQKNDNGEQIELVNGSFTLRHGETIRFNNLPEGLEWIVEEVEAAGYKASVKKANGTVAREQTSKVKFVNHRDDPEEEIETGDLIITKMLAGDERDEKAQFRFRVTFKDEQGRELSADYPYYIEGDDTPRQLQDSMLLLKAGEQAYFRDLPAGITWLVEELPEEGYIQLITGMEGHITKAETAQADFVNHKRTERTGELEVCKQLAGSEGNPDDSFTFWITFDGSEDAEFPVMCEINGKAYTLKDGTFTLKGGERAIFTGIPAGTVYRIEELSSADGYIQGKTEHSGMIAVGQKSEAVFINYRQDMTEIVIRKEVKGEVADRNQAFHFTFTTDAYKEQFSLKHDEEKTFLIPRGVKYRLEEQADKEYLQTSVTNGYGTGGQERIEIVKTNTKKPVIIDPPPEEEGRMMKVEKVWKGDGEDVRPGYILVQIYRDGQPFGSQLQMGRENNWKHSWIGLPEQFSWTVDEVSSHEDYQKSVSGDEEQGYKITNTYLKEYTGGSDGDGNIDNDGNNGSGDNNSSGGNSGHNSGDENNKAAKTGDQSNIWIWTLLMIGSAIALRHLLLRKENDNVTHCDL